MNRPSTIALLLGCLALLSRGASVAPSSALAQEKGHAEAATGGEPAAPNSGPETGGAVSDPDESSADDDSDEDEPGNGGGNDEEDSDDGGGTDEAANGSPAVRSGPQS